MICQIWLWLGVIRWDTDGVGETMERGLIKGERGEVLVVVLNQITYSSASSIRFGLSGNGASPVGQSKVTKACQRMV